MEGIVAHCPLHYACMLLEMHSIPSTLFKWWLSCVAITEYFPVTSKHLVASLPAVPFSDSAFPPQVRGSDRERPVAHGSLTAGSVCSYICDCVFVCVFVCERELEWEPEIERKKERKKERKREVEREQERAIDRRREHPRECTRVRKRDCVPAFHLNIKHRTHHKVIPTER